MREIGKLTCSRVKENSLVLTKEYILEDGKIINSMATGNLPGPTVRSLPENMNSI
jgi:hypothetical protein